MLQKYDALLVVSFGGPEGPDEVMPFLENVLRGKNVPHERMLEVAEHYRHFGGVSPINTQNRELIAAVEADFASNGLDLPVYWGNRNWHPLLPDTLRKMREDGVRRALAFFTSAYSSYSGCRQYREDIARAQAEVGEGAPQIDKLRVFFNHPGFIEPMVELTKQALDSIPEAARARTRLLFTAHSIPLGMAEGCNYELQLREASKLVADRVSFANWQLVYQSRSGPPTQPWLEPDVNDVVRALHTEGDLEHIVVVPIGFISDHMEVLFDLDTEVKQLCNELGLQLHRVPTVGTHPRFVTMIRELVRERTTVDREREALGELGPSHDFCPLDCCKYTPRRPPISGGN